MFRGTMQFGSSVIHLDDRPPSLWRKVVRWIRRVVLRRKDLTVTTHGFRVGDTLTVTDSTNPRNNGSYTITRIS